MELKTLPERSGMSCWPTARQLAPCENSCPIKMNIPGFVISIAQEEFEDAYAIMRQTNPFPGVCGYVCHHPCEEVCVRAKIDEPIAIKSMRRFVVDRKLRQGTEKVAPVKPWKEKVAIIGSGPAGLTCAQDLALQGYAVTVYEARPVVGGMLTAAIPEFVLPRKVSEAEIGYIKDLGIEIKTNVRLGKDLTVEDIRRQGFKAVFLAVGAWQSLKLNIPGLDLDGVFHALPLLQDMNQGKGAKLDGKVMVIGGGNVGMDAARAALRLGAKEVLLACLECREEMPAFEWEIRNAEEEGVIMHDSRAIQEIVGQDGKVAGANFVGVKSIEIDDVGRIRPTLIEDSKYPMDANYVIIAIGQSLEPSVLEGVKGIELNKKGTIAADPDTLATNLPGVFAGGDVVVGAGTVVEAIAAGHRAALSIDRYLRGEELQDTTPPQQVMDVEDERLPLFVERRERTKMPRSSAEKRLSSSEEVVDLGFSKEAAIAEAKRCLSCPVCGVCMYYRSQMCYETALRLL